MNQLESYITKHNLQTAEVLRSDTKTLTVQQSSKSFGIKPSEIVKSLVIKTKPEGYYLVILLGNTKINFNKIKEILNVRDAHLASPDDVLEHSNYPVGDVPPISVELPVIMDEKVLNNDIVYGGGGSPNANLKIGVKELVETTNPKIANFSKDK